MSYFKSIRKGANLNYDKKILDIIKNEVATYYHIPIEYLNRRITRDERKKNVTNARQMAIYLSIELTSIDRVIIANSFGIYDTDTTSARAFIIYLSADFSEYFSNHDKNLEIVTNRIKSICEKKIKQLKK